MLTLDLHDYQDPATDQFLGRGNLLVTFAMGLGKTPIGIACAEELLGCGDIGLAVIVVEASLKYQWAQEIAKFTDVPRREMKLRSKGKVETIVIPAGTHCSIIDGKSFQRNKVKYSPADDRERQYKAITSKTDYMIISYDNLVDDERWIRKLMDERECLVILDEATAIKTFSAGRTKTIKRIIKAPYRLALTGTPVDNRLEELFSIMEWVDPTVLGRWDLFEAAYIVRNDYGVVKRYKNLDTLRQRIAPAIARISHDDPRVKGYIPKAHQSERYVEPSPALESAFREIAEELLAQLSVTRQSAGFDMQAYYKGEHNESTGVGLAMAMLGAIDLMTAHPDLLVISAQDYERSEAQRQAGVERAVWPGSKYAYDKWQQGLVDDITTSPKLAALVQRVDEILAEDSKHKVLVYTSHRHILDYMSDEMADKGFEHVQYHGGMNAREKAAAQASFTQNDNVRVWLSTHAGARGTNLYKGSHLINYDLPWSAGMADQINGRHVRASSSFRDVWVENMITDRTTDLWRLGKVRYKRRIGVAVLDEKGDRMSVVENDGAGLKAFLTDLLEGFVGTRV